jgi:hypothetical protein
MSKQDDRIDTQVGALSLQLSPGLKNPDQVQPKLYNPLQFLRDWLDRLEIHDPWLARWLCKTIPAQCPFERDVVLFKRRLAHIPPLCKLNPLFDQLVGLRFRALCYLADSGVDVTPLIER